MEGWIKLHRKILDSKYGYNLELRGLFDSLLLMANHKEGYTADGTKILPGQFMTSQLELSKRFKISRAKVQRLLSKLCDAGQIEQLTSPRNTIITISNWLTYQVDEQQASTKRAPSEQQPSTNKNVNNNKNTISDLKIADDYAPEFFDGVIETPKKNLPKAQSKASRKSEGLSKSPLSFLFKPGDEIHAWLTGKGASENIQQELLENYSHHILAAEIKSAFQWQLEKKGGRNAGFFLKTWMGNKPKKQAYGDVDPLDEFLAPYKEKMDQEVAKMLNQAGA